MAKKQYEIDEDEYTAAQGVIAAVSKIASNPKAKKLMQQARKLAEPDAIIPDLDTDDLVSTAVGEVKSELAKWREEMAADRKAQQEEAARAKFAKGWNEQKDLLRGEGYFEETITEVEKLAQERGIPDLEAAALLHRKLHPPADVNDAFSGQSYNFFEPKEDEKSYVKALMESKGEDEGALRGEINAALRESRTGQRRAA